MVGRRKATQENDSVSIVHNFGSGREIEVKVTPTASSIGNYKAKGQLCSKGKF